MRRDVGGPRRSLRAERVAEVTQAGAWLVFLAYPVQTVISDPRYGMGTRVAGLAVIVMFVGVYLAGFWGNTNALRMWIAQHRVRPSSAATLGVLAALVVLLALMCGNPAYLLCTYVVAYAMFQMPGLVAGVALAVVVAVSSAFAVAGGRGGLANGYYPTSMVVIGLIVVFGLVTRNQVRRRMETAVASDAASRAGERERIAADVHDLLGQSLTVMAMKTELVGRLVDTDPQGAKQQAADVHSMARDSLAQVRALVDGLRSSGLDTQLAEARTALAAAGVRLTVHDMRDPGARAGGDGTAFDVVRGWALREAVTNVVRHSGAHNCAIDLGDDTLRITDDGVGLNGAPEGNGRSGMRRRVDAAGGDLWIGPGPNGRGTRVLVTG